MFFTGIYDWENKIWIANTKTKKKNKSLLGAENCKMIL